MNKINKNIIIKEKQKMRLRINDSMILWPGKIRKKPEGIMIPTHLKVLTIEEKPFVYVRKLSDDEIDCEVDEIPCPHFNVSNGMGKIKMSYNSIYNRRKGKRTLFSSAFLLSPFPTRLDRKGLLLQRLLH